MESAQSPLSRERVRTLARFTCNGNIPAHHSCELLAQRQTEAGAAVILGRARVSLREGLEKFVQLIWYQPAVPSVRRRSEREAMSTALL